jgi:hypothetical protein
VGRGSEKVLKRILSQERWCETGRMRAEAGDEETRDESYKRRKITEQLYGGKDLDVELRADIVPAKAQRTV